MTFVCVHLRATTSAKLPEMCVFCMSLQSSVWYIWIHAFCWCIYTI